jgi:lysylphosphatidylglycerol synthetase-like protein (DUF2156 family)
MVPQSLLPPGQNALLAKAVEHARADEIQRLGGTLANPLVKVTTRRERPAFERGAREVFAHAERTLFLVFSTHQLSFA